MSSTSIKKLLCALGRAIHGTSKQQQKLAQRQRAASSYDLGLRVQRIMILTSRPMAN